MRDGMVGIGDRSGEKARPQSRARGNIGPLRRDPEGELVTATRPRGPHYSGAGASKGGCATPAMRSSARRFSQLVQQGLRRDEIARVEAFGEPSIDGRER